MANILSSLIGFVSLVLAGIAFLPFFGWANWFIIPLPIIGLAVGCFSKQTSGRSINMIAILFAVFRLIIGGGIF
ncbi:MAG: hypothetical protein ABF461_06045 [Zymomonas mobilis subsp. pomaceae]|uniref:Uncharacterized protein n=1 Tax=Zymomonas mobilis subsp. pomaceae (strain ATCC 29192 / DSM 22645 / JCM 10191 / CCUG 17912 / NBRC 13757 / NCIMB 11200 / NRRL B-4491 / Barker I) TaxID=579138 RepID=F8ESA0_ZYMMT|nr:hypothetical protein [Zymomonas mobilis]AEI37675.1 conserved hypothetical protein [Zymomonas mobilis subsp. pomaceae ATCC 29192]MDX5949042.1 hypothetical protein [Zymomonas mobilis subsp. pomaceae]GEB88847.1 hypothetical protein ZMO02_04840 [Zymomonas mobilis subsp. pomaceae]